MRTFAFCAVLALMSCAQGHAQPVHEPVARGVPDGDLRIVGNPTLKGLSGTARPGRKPLFSQKVVFNRAIQLLEPFEIKWNFIDKEKYKEGERLYGRGEYWCGAYNVCMSDADKDGRLDSGFQQYVMAPHRMLLVSRTGRKLEPPNVMAAYQPAEPPLAFEHGIGIGVSDIRFEKDTNQTVAVFVVSVRRADYQSNPWQEIVLRGSRAPVSADGKARFEMFGAVVDITVTDAKRKAFAWTLVEPFPEQPLPQLTAF